VRKEKRREGEVGLLARPSFDTTWPNKEESPVSGSTIRGKFTEERRKKREQEDSIDDQPSKQPRRRTAGGKRRLSGKGRGKTILCKKNWRGGTGHKYSMTGRGRRHGGGRLWSCRGDSSGKNVKKKKNQNAERPNLVSPKKEGKDGLNEELYGGDVKSRGENASFGLYSYL